MRDPLDPQHGSASLGRKNPPGVKREADSSSAIDLGNTVERLNHNQKKMTGVTNVQQRQQRMQNEQLRKSSLRSQKITQLCSSAPMQPLKSVFQMQKRGKEGRGRKGKCVEAEIAKRAVYSRGKFELSRAAKKLCLDGSSTREV